MRVLSKSRSWSELPLTSKVCLTALYIAALPAAFVCLYRLSGVYSLPWVSLTCASAAFATANLRLPKAGSVIIAAGDVFTILALIYFGPGPALVTAWAGSVTASLSDQARRHGSSFYTHILFYRFTFNLAASPLSVLPMSLAYKAVVASGLPYPLHMIVGLAAVAAIWFLINTITFAAGVSLWSQQSFGDVFRNGLGLSLLNFFGSAGCAGLITLLYGRVDIYVLLLAAPVALLVYRLYRYHIVQTEQAEAHISELHNLYEQAVRTQEAQSQSEERYRSLVETASDAIFSLSSERRINSLNSAFEKITGWPVTAWLDHPFDLLIHPDDLPRTLNSLGGALHGQTILLPEIRMATKAGGFVFVECTVTPHLQNGSVIGLLGIARDMTERNRLTESLRQSQKMEAIGRLAGGVAHDFNNTLVSILGYSELLLERFDPADRGHHMAEEIQRAGRQAASLTRQLLAFSRKQIIQPIPMDLNTVVLNMDSMLRRVIGEDIELVTRLESPVGVVKADPGQIDQVLLNLAVNSRDAMPNGGRLTLESRDATSAEVGEAMKTVVPPGDYVMLAVTDTGMGISPEIQSMIFEPFFTTKEVGKGTGLGLATVYGIVSQAGGYIAVESALNQGTSFKIFLPRVNEEVQAAKMDQQHLRPSAHETVLLVEDEDAVRALATTILKRAGYVVLEAQSGDEAIDIARKHPGPIDALVTDLVMPRMSGREVAEAVRKLRSNINVLYMSGYSDDVISHHGVLHESTAFLQKPFGPAELARKVHDLLHAPSR